MLLECVNSEFGVMIMHILTQVEDDGKRGPAKVGKSLISFASNNFLPLGNEFMPIASTLLFVQHYRRLIGYLR